ncbi:MAG: arginine deiminase family protein [Eubacteriales bacterium]|nr:arginine deiminase family protein [Eubacteriales bacterium]
MKVGCQSMVDKIDTIILKRPEDAFISQEYLDENWEKWGFFARPDFQECITEYRAFENIIRSLVPNVLMMPKDEAAGLDSIYTHDSVKFTKEGAIILNMGKATRRNEPASMRDFLEKNNIPILGEITGEGRVEGGDVLWLEDDRVAIGRGYRTNDEGIRQFTELTKGLVKEVITVPMPHGNSEEECLHLMSVISPVSKDTAVIYSRYMPVFFRQMLKEMKLNLIELIDEEYMPLGGNILAVEPGVVVTLSGNPDVKKKLKDAGIVVHEYVGDNISHKGNGGATCMTAPVYRIS